MSCCLWLIKISDPISWWPNWGMKWRFTSELLVLSLDFGDKNIDSSRKVKFCFWLYLDFLIKVLMIKIGDWNLNLNFTFNFCLQNPKPIHQHVNILIPCSVLYQNYSRHHLCRWWIKTLDKTIQVKLRYIIANVAMRRTNNGEKLNNCNQCDYASSDASHFMMHSPEKMNKCNQCDYASPKAGNLRRHLKTHTGEKSNKCYQCDYASSEAGAIWGNI